MMKKGEGGVAAMGRSFSYYCTVIIRSYKIVQWKQGKKETPPNVTSRKI